MRRFRVRVDRTSGKSYEVTLGGTADPEPVDVDWLAIVAGLDPVEDHGEYVALASVREVDDGQ